uniref:Phage tail collar domain-containing protein n=1 Tax=viral metagenome TaxID=1070528 RepID=A0A6C0DXK5_9ZZZZ
MVNLIYDISYFEYSLDNSTKQLQYVSLTNSLIPWGINTTYIYKNDVMSPQFNANNNDLVIENRTNNIVLKTPSSKKTIIENGLSVDTLYIKSKNIEDSNSSVPYITNTNNAITVVGSFTISGDFNIRQDINSTGSFANSNITNSTIEDCTIIGGFIRDISIINVKINSSDFIGGSIINTNFTGGSLNVNNGSIRTCTIENCNFQGTSSSIICPNIYNSTLTGSSIVNCNLTEGSISCRNIFNSTLTGSSIVNCDLTGGSISCRNITNSIARDISITLFSLSGGTLTNANISRSTASDISINNYTLSSGTLTNANISRSRASDISISLFSLSGGTLTFANISRSTASDISINNYTLSGGTIIASNIGCNDFGVFNVPKRGAFTNISVLNNGILDISQGTIRAKTISGDTISGTTISGGTISATTIFANSISGSAIRITPNAVSGTRVININTGNVNTSNGIAINNVSVATTQHIINAIPPGLIMAYYYTAPMPLPPNGWAICNGLNGTPDLSGRFILGFTGAPNPIRPLNSIGGAEKVRLDVNELPSHTHGAFRYGFGEINRGNFGENRAVINTTLESAYNVPTGNNQAHENMPPYYVLYYIMKLNDYNFNY